MFSGVMIWVSVKCLETICIVVEVIQIKIEVNWIELTLNVSLMLVWVFKKLLIN